MPLAKGEIETVELSAYRKTVESISTQIKAKTAVVIGDTTTFAKEAVAVVADKEGNVLSPAQFGCIQISPDLKFFPIVGVK